MKSRQILNGGEYGLQIRQSGDKCAKLAVVSSLDNVIILDSDQLNEETRIMASDCSCPIVDLSFLDNSNLVVCGKQKLQLFDCMSGELKQLTDSVATVAPFTACCANARFVCAGTEYQNYEAHVFIWDALYLTDNPKYKLSESFGNDISCLRFHPYQDNLLYVSATDGLISIIDIDQLSSQTFGVDGEYDNGEGDALIQTLNVGSSVAKFEFFGQNVEFLWVITDMNSLQIWCVKTYQLLSNHRFSNGVWPLSCIFIPSSSMLFCLATSDQEGQVLIYKVLLDHIPQAAQFSISSTSSIRDILWCENQNAMISITEDGQLCKSLVYFKNSAQ